MAAKLFSAPDEVVQLARQLRNERMLAPAFQVAELYKSITAAGSLTGAAPGMREHPFDRQTVAEFTAQNAHHSACVNAKVTATVGLGYEDSFDQTTTVDPQSGIISRSRKPMMSKTDELLNPLCEESWADLLLSVAQDYYSLGDGAIEVVPDGPGGAIVGLHHLPATEYRIFVESRQHRHFTIASASGSEVRMARWGDSEGLQARIVAGEVANAGELSTRSFDPQTAETEEHVSEVIFFRQPSNLVRYYGFPSWLAATPMVELARMLTQWKFDFFQNRGVPEFFLFITGAKLPKKEWDAILDAMKSCIGEGASHKSLAVNISQPDVTVQVEKLALDGNAQGEDFPRTHEAVALQICTAHQTPPLLAGITIPGKLGSANELPNAISVFQTLVIAHQQRIFWMTLAQTLAGPNGIEGLEPDDLTFRRITEEMDLPSMDTVSRMRQTPAQAASEGRSLSDGVRD